MVLILSSCITGQDDVGPEWIRRPPVIFGSLVFIGHGYGENTTEARTAALDDALASMSAGADYDLSQYYLREIVSTDGIAELGTYINSEYSTPSGGGFEHYVAVVTPESSYNSLMSEDYVQMLEREDRIRGYLDSAGERYRANEDTEALDSTLRALAVSLEGPVEDESLNSSSILSIAMEYLGNIELEANDAGVVTAKRSKGIFHPYIVSGKIDASYERFDADGNRRCAQHGLPEGKPAPAEAKQDPKRKHQHKIGDDPPENKGVLFAPCPEKGAEQGKPRHPFRFRLPSEKGHGEQKGKIDEKKDDPTRAKQGSAYSVRGNRMFHFLLCPVFQLSSSFFAQARASSMT